MDERHERSRRILLSARLQFSPETQPIRTTAVRAMTEQALLLVDRDGGVSLPALVREGAFKLPDDTVVVTENDAQAALEELTGEGRVEREERDGHSHYRLAERARAELWAFQQEAERTISKTIDRLFRDAPGTAASYSDAFLHCLSEVFAALAEVYVRTLSDNGTKRDFVNRTRLTAAVERSARVHLVDGDALSAAVRTFFLEQDPEFDRLKWNFAQNYFVSKCLGMDPAGRLLSEEMFGDAVFYLDTNVLLHLVEPEAGLHDSLRNLALACESIRAKFAVSQVTIDELRAVVERKRTELAKVADLIPAASAHRVHGLFYEVYLKRVQDGEDVDIAALFSNLERPLEHLPSGVKVELVDDEWFEESRPRLEPIAAVVSAEAEAGRGYGKPAPVAMHDALMVSWMVRKRSEDEAGWFLTRDRTIDSEKIRDAIGADRPVAISVDALMQWIAPRTHIDGEDGSFAALFSTAIRSQLLPQKQVLDIHDFVVFAELDIACQDLPSDDVEKCVAYLKRNAPGLDPTSPKDLQVLARQIARFMADPGRKFQQDLARARRETADLRSVGRATFKRQEKEREKLEVTNAQLQRLASDSEKSRVESLDTARAKLREQRLRSSAQNRLWVVFVLLAVYETAMVIATLHYAEGTNDFQKLLGAWPFLGGGVVGALFGAWVWLGADRIQALGGALKRLLSRND